MIKAILKRFKPAKPAPTFDSITASMAGMVEQLEDLAVDKEYELIVVQDDIEELHRVADKLAREGKQASDTAARFAALLG